MCIRDRDISATDVIWAFFDRYTLDGQVTGVNEISTDPAITISPNPTSDRLHINTSLDIVHTDIYDLTGRKVMSANASKVIDIESLSCGIYTVAISYGPGSRTSAKFVKE